MTSGVESLIGREFPVLDHGFVRLVDVMGSDESIVQAARVSYGKGTKKRHEDQGLIRYLMRHHHTTPFEMVEFKFHVKLPIFVARQWIRHRTANVNEYSGRYSVMEDEFYLPPIKGIRYQSKTNRQARSDEELPVEEQKKFLQSLQHTTEKSYRDYQEFIEAGGARELARIGLPLALYTQWYWKIDLHNLLHFLRLRLDVTAQAEFQEYARVMAKIVKKVCPLAWQAFEDYQLNAISFSVLELRVLADYLSDIDTSKETLKTAGLKMLEINEFRDKIERLKKLRDSE